MLQEKKDLVVLIVRLRPLVLQLKQNVGSSKDSIAECVRTINLLNSQVADLRKENGDASGKLRKAEQEIAALREQNAALAARAGQSDEERGLDKFTDLLGPLKERMRTQRDWDAELHEMWREIASDHFRLERAKVMESHSDYLRGLSAESRVSIIEPSINCLQLSAGPPTFVVLLNSTVQAGFRTSEDPSRATPSKEGSR